MLAAGKTCNLFLQPRSNAVDLSEVPLILQKEPQTFPLGLTTYLEG